MQYEKLSPREFDAVVTGEATHLATWFEDELVDLICDYFVGRTARRKDMTRIVFYGGGARSKTKCNIFHAAENLMKRNKLSKYILQRSVPGNFSPCRTI